MATRPSGKLLRLAAAVAFALPASTAAQTLDVKELREADDDGGIAYEGRSVENLEDMDVVGSGGKRIGEIEEILVNAGNEIVAVVVEYDDGVLDRGEREVVMPIDRLEFGPLGTKATAAMSEDELKALDVWDD